MDSWFFQWKLEYRLEILQNQIYWLLLNFRKNYFFPIYFSLAEIYLELCF